MGCGVSPVGTDGWPQEIFREALEHHPDIKELYEQESELNTMLSAVLAKTRLRVLSSFPSSTRSMFLDR